MAQTKKVQGKATSVIVDGAITQVKLYDTIVVAFGNGKCTLDSGGFQTATTQRRMTQAANEYELGFGVYQRAGKWYVVLPNGETVEFYDGITFEL